MKSIRIKIILLTSIVLVSLTIPTVNSVADLWDKCELIENACGEEEKSEEKESDNIEEFMLYAQLKYHSIVSKKSLYFIHNENFSYSTSDVITPPPEFT